MGFCLHAFDSFEFCNYLRVGSFIVSISIHTRANTTKNFHTQHNATISSLLPLLVLITTHHVLLERACETAATTSTLFNTSLCASSSSSLSPLLEPSPDSRNMSSSSK
eukprot:c27227_g1_i1.p1 GENE.c27227_g1_i1~~c27227_g1_i1.p1  ORF type:complete len:108 (-),score=20.91 c27227_g1_i1:39-362(-)